MQRSKRSESASTFEEEAARLRYRPFTFLPFDRQTIIRQHSNLQPIQPMTAVLTTVLYCDWQILSYSRAMVQRKETKRSQL